MKYRKLGKTNWEISEVGYGMWGMGGWTGSDDEESLLSLQQAVDLGCNFFDTAWGYGEGKSENLLGRLVRANPGKKIYTATKIPPKNRKWPSLTEYGLENCYPPDHLEEYVHKSLKNFGLESVDLMQLHTWDDSWAEDDRWISKMMDMKSQGLFKAIGISMNRWEPWNGVKAVRSGIIDSVQLIYNIFDQNPKDELFPACREMNVGVIARVPLDEGSLTGTLTKDSKWPKGDWRNSYFVPENLIPTVERVEKLKALVPEEMTLTEMALRFILGEQTISTMIPGMRKLHHVESNIAISDAGPLDPALMKTLEAHRWVRHRTAWSQ